MIQAISHIAHMRVKPALVTGRLVLVQQSFSGHAVDDGHGFFVGFARQLLVTCGHGLDNILDMCAQSGTLTCLAQTAVIRLSRTFTCLCRISQNRTPVPGLKEPGTMRFPEAFVNLSAHQMALIPAQ